MIILDFWFIILKLWILWDDQACNTIGMIGMNHPNGGRNHPKDPCHWDEIIPMDGGWLPHWDEALDESTGIIEAVYFAPYLYGGRSPPYN